MDRENLEKIISEMTKVFDRVVKSYRDDFTTNDIPTLCEIINWDWESLNVYWFVRECGTNLYIVDGMLSEYNKNTLDTLARANDEAYIVYEDGTLMPVNKEVFYI